MILRIGNREAFSLIEVMVTVSILALGTVAICQANLAALNAYSRYTGRLAVRGWAEEKIWEAKESLLQSEFPEAGKTSGQFRLENRNYEWELDIESYEVKDFYSIDLQVKWRAGVIPLALSRASFMQKLKKA